MLAEDRPEEDHARGLAAMPESSNAPASLSMRHSTEHGASESGPSSAGSAQARPGVAQQEAGVLGLFTLSGMCGAVLQTCRIAFLRHVWHCPATLLYVSVFGLIRCIKHRME